MRKGRRFVSLVLSILMLLALVSEPSRAVRMVIFTAANEKLYPLTDETMPFWSNGNVYVPHTALIDNDFNIQFSRNRERGTAALYQLRNGITFDLNAGSAESRSGQMYIAQAVERGDIIFFPLSLVCMFFNLEYSYTRVTYGYLLRIKNESVILSDPVFIDAAGPSMTQRYTQYERTETPAVSEPSVPSQTPPPPAPAERTVYLAFESTDAASSELLLSRLSSGSAAFLFTPQAMLDSGDLLRRLSVHGGNVALRIDASGGAEDALARIREANELFWSAASAKTRLVLLDGASSETILAVAEAGYCPLRFHLDYSENRPGVSRVCSQILAAADRSGGSCSVFLGADAAALDTLSALLSGLSDGNCTPSRLNETVLAAAANSQNV
ncbi:MAG: hypothetical protein IJU66_09315 [Oscillospiraceae bacterium]|nr:hypothetical protein [Oscillospiraceae bacterium]